ncbi:hypothetical protein BT69DRAFT_1286846 [Atractiella rhizophila]|nr:hypothetical protein BT69DRAFT_1286846 [Atractiella rhizophila]
MCKFIRFGAIVQEKKSIASLRLQPPREKDPPPSEPGVSPSPSPVIPPFVSPHPSTIRLLKLIHRRRETPYPYHSSSVAMSKRKATPHTSLSAQMVRVPPWVPLMIRGSQWRGWLTISFMMNFLARLSLKQHPALRHLAKILEGLPRPREEFLIFAHSY